MASANSTFPIDPPRAPTTAHAYTIPALSLFGILILIVPFIFHLRARNIGACALIGYLSLYNLMVLVNVLIWPDENFSDWYDGAILCDVELRLLWPATVGIASSTMAITRALAIVLDVENAELNPSRAQRRRKVLIDLAICFAVPIIIAGLYYIIQNRRYLILAISGCMDAYINSWPTILIIYMWPLIFTLANVYYAALVILRLRRHRESIVSILSSHSLNTSRFLRLFIMSMLLLLVYLPMNIYWFYVNVSQPIVAYTWASFHDPAVWNQIVYFPAQGVFTFDHYIPGAMALFVFAFFGTGAEARRIYTAVGAACGLGYCFPRLLRERRSSADGTSPSKQRWMDRFSLVAMGKRYLSHASTRGSQATEMTSTTAASSRKPSGVVVEHIPTLPLQPAAPSSLRTSLHPSPPLSPSTPAPTPPPRSRISRILTKLHITRSPDRNVDIPLTPTFTQIVIENRNLAHISGSRTHVWSPRSLAVLDDGARQGDAMTGRFERLESIGSEATGIGECAGEGEVKVKTKVGVRVETV